MIRKMKRQKNIFLFLGAFLIIGAGLFTTWKMFFSEQRGSIQNFTDLVSNEEGAEEYESNDEGESTLDEETGAEQTTSEVRETKSFVVDAAICDGECVQYQDNPEALTYCQAVCGLPSSEGAARPNPADCSTATEGMNKDICLRDKAVAANNSELCEDITDKSLRDSCRNRIAEERFD